MSDCVQDEQQGQRECRPIHGTHHGISPSLRFKLADFQLSAEF